MVATATGLRTEIMPEPSAITILAIKAIAETQTLPRICGLLAQFDVMPTTLTCRRAGVLMIIDIEFRSRQETREELLLAKIQALVQVRRASMVANG